MEIWSHQLPSHDQEGYKDRGRDELEGDLDLARRYVMILDVKLITSLFLQSATPWKSICTCTRASYALPRIPISLATPSTLL
jgi:hypothetical protein